MAESLPSKRFVNVDIPEVTDFQAEFIYNFFTADERVNDSGLGVPASISRRAAENFDSQLVDSNNFRRFVPRLVRFRWKPKVDVGRSLNKSTPSIKDNFTKIHNEQTFTTDDYTSMFFQDNGQDQKLVFLIKRALDEIRNRQDPKNSESPLDIVRFINARTDKNVGSRFLTESFIQLINEGTIFLDANNREIIGEKLLKEISNVKVRIQINNKILEKALKTTSQSTLSLFNDEVATQLHQAKEIQERAVSQKNSSIINGLDYDFEILDFIGIRAIDPTTFDSTAQVIGYVIDKEEVSAEGNVVSREPIIVENGFASETIDLKVQYGSTYVYSIRSIALVELAVEDTDSDDIIALSFLVSSQPSSRVIVETEERVPPPPPADFNVSFDYQQEALRLMWNFPVNTQRDIKAFQIFRRRNILEPFELIQQYDFDNSLIRTVPREFPDEQLIDFLSGPKSYYIDREFTRNSSFIYTVCAIDAHGFSSNYTTQFLITFDRFRNRVNREVVSLSGAPKAYPNAFLLRDTFVDTIRDSGHNKVKVIFNPEFLNILNAQGNDLGLIKTDGDSKYRLQLINTDLQEQQVIDITIADRRTTTEKNEEE